MKGISSKYHLMYLILLFCSGILKGQQDTTIFGPLGATWYYSTWVPPYPPSLLKFVSDGDTILNGVNARILKFYSGESGVLEPLPSLDKYVYTSGNKVYYWVEDAFYLLFDFGAQPGDTIYSRVEDFPISFSCFADFDQGPFDFRYKIDSVGSIEISGEILRTQYVSPIYDPIHIGWVIENPIIERIGQITTSCYWWGRGQGCLLGGIPGELRCYEDSNIYFKNNTQFDLECDYVSATDLISESVNRVYPNPASDMIILHGEPAFINIYNIFGNQVAAEINNQNVDISHLPSDIYIIHYQIDGIWYVEKLFKL